MSVNASAISAWLGTTPDAPYAVAYADTNLQSLDPPVPGRKMTFNVPTNYGDVISDLAVVADIPALPAGVRLVTDPATAVTRALPQVTVPGGARVVAPLDPAGLVKAVREYTLLGGSSTLLRGTPRLEHIWRRLEGDAENRAMEVDVQGQFPQTLMLPIRFNLSDLPMLPTKGLTKQELRLQLDLTTDSLLKKEAQYFVNPAATTTATTRPTSVLPEDMHARYDDLRRGSLPNNTLISADVTLVDPGRHLAQSYSPTYKWTRERGAETLVLRRECSYHFTGSELTVARTCFVQGGVPLATALKSDVHSTTAYVYNGRTGTSTTANGDVVVRGQHAALKQRPYRLTLVNYSPSAGGAAWDVDPAQSEDHAEFLAVAAVGARFTVRGNTYTVTAKAAVPGAVRLTTTTTAPPLTPLPAAGQAVDAVLLDDPRETTTFVLEFNQVGQVLVRQDGRTPALCAVAKSADTGTDFVSLVPGASCWYLPTFAAIQNTQKVIRFTLTTVSEAYRLAIDQAATPTTNWMDFQEGFASKVSTFFYTSALDASAAAPVGSLLPECPRWLDPQTAWTRGNYLTASFRLWDPASQGWGSQLPGGPALRIAGVPGDNVLFDYLVYQPDLPVYYCELDGTVSANHAAGLFPPFFPAVSQPRLGRLPDDRAHLPVYQYALHTLTDDRPGSIVGRYSDLVARHLTASWRVEVMLGILYTTSQVKTELELPVTLPTLVHAPYTTSRAGDVVRVTLPACGVARELLFTYTPHDVEGESVGASFFRTCALKLNNQALHDPPRGPEYFRTYLPFRHHKHVPRRSADGPDLYCLPLTDAGGNGQGLDLLSFSDVCLEFRATEAPRDGTVTVYVLTNNVLSVLGGQATLKYAY